MQFLKENNIAASFNPRSRTGSDVRVDIVLLCLFRVSIHAPARGATVHPRRVRAVRGEFQSTLPHGERPDQVPGLVPPVEFQSTLPHGERPHLQVFTI